MENLLFADEPRTTTIEAYKNHDGQIYICIRDDDKFDLPSHIVLNEETAKAFANIIFKEIDNE